MFNFKVSIFKFFELTLKIRVDLFEKFFCCLFTCDLLPIFENSVMIVFNTIILLSHFHEFFLIIFQEVIVFNELFVNIQFMFNVFFFLFETDLLNKISLCFNSIVLVVKLEILNFCSVDHTGKFIFHFWIFVVGRDCMSDNRILIFIQQSHNTHSFIFLLFLFPWLLIKNTLIWFPYWGNEFVSISFICIHLKCWD